MFVQDMGHSKAFFGEGSGLVWSGHQTSDASDRGGGGGELVTSQT